MKRTLAAVAIAATLTALGAGAAQATETYPAPAPPSTVSQGTVQAGNTVTFSGSGFTPGEQIVITADAGTAGSASAAGSRSVASRVALAPLQIETQADAAGKFSVEVTLSEPGVYTLTAKGVTSGVIQTNVVTVQAPVTGVAAQSSTMASLPDMGADPSLILWGLVGAGALVAGTTSVILVRRSSSSAATS